MASISCKGVTICIPTMNHTSHSIRHRLIETFSTQPASQHKIVGFQNILYNLTIQINDGDRLGIFGPNGSGKTTLLRLFAGIYKPTKGVFELSGQVKTLINISAGLDPNLSGLENIVRLCVINGMSPREAQENCNNVVEFADLGKKIHEPVRTYSSGMVLRLVSGTIFTKDTDIFLVDEFISVGDEAFSKKVELKMNELFESSKILVFSSHSKTKMLQYCNRFLSIDHGVCKEVSAEFLASTSNQIN